MLLGPCLHLLIMWRGWLEWTGVGYFPFTTWKTRRSWGLGIFLSLGQVGSDTTPAGQSLVAHFLLRAHLVRKNRMLWYISKCLFLLPLPEASGDFSLIVTMRMWWSSWRKTHRRSKLQGSPITEFPGVVNSQSCPHWASNNSLQFSFPMAGSCAGLCTGISGAVSYGPLYVPMGLSNFGGSTSMSDDLTFFMGLKKLLIFHFVQLFTIFRTDRVVISKLYMWGQIPAGVLLQSWSYLIPSTSSGSVLLVPRTHYWLSSTLPVCSLPLSSHDMPLLVLNVAFLKKSSNEKLSCPWGKI